MKTGLTAFDRRIEIMFKILRYGKTTIAELALEYSVSSNTARNDIVFIGRYVPLYTKHGKYGGIFVEENYNRNGIMFYLSKDEEKLLLEFEASQTGRRAQIIRNILNKYSMHRA